MRRARLQAPTLKSREIRIDGPPAHHALHVLRLKRGAEIILFDGYGAEAKATITTVGPDWFTALLTESQRSAPISKPRFIIAVSPPRFQRGDWLVEKCGELGVAELWMFTSERSTVIPHKGKLDRWRRKAAEAARQSESHATMHIELKKDLPEMLSGLPPATSLLYGTPRSSVSTLYSSLTAEIDPRSSASAILVIGPEGGLSEQETAILQSRGGIPVRLSPTVLRTETACVAAAAIWNAWLLGHILDAS